MLTFIFGMLMSMAKADSGTIPWPSRQSKVICGGTVDGESLNFHVVSRDEVLGTSSEDERVLLYVDLHKPGQVHWVMSEALSDDEYAKREAAMAKLSAEEADLIRSLSRSRQTDLYAGMTDGFVHLDMTTQKHKLSLSCREVTDRTF